MHLLVPRSASAHPHHAYATATAPQIRSAPFAHWLVERLAGLATGH
ncbi:MULTISPECIES: hypothetical protein [Pseudomonadota]|nr:hypothetical protein [Acidovorax sp. PRC11]MDT0136689.1 hypothetical protein [Acidovorax sp. PRC11]